MALTRRGIFQVESTVLAPVETILVRRQHLPARQEIVLVRRQQLSLRLEMYLQRRRHALAVFQKHLRVRQNVAAAHQNVLTESRQHLQPRENDSSERRKRPPADRNHPQSLEIHLQVVRTILCAAPGSHQALPHKDLLRGAALGADQFHESAVLGRPQPCHQSAFTFDDPNLRWSDPSYILEPGDPGYPS